MADWARQEIEEAFRAYWMVGAIEERWTEWPERLTEDVVYVEHIYGNMKGREAVRRWIVDVMQDNPHVHAVLDWFMIEESRVVVNMQNRYYHPNPSAAPIDFPGITILEYAGDGLFGYEEDYWCLRGAKRAA